MLDVIRKAEYWRWLAEHRCRQLERDVVRTTI